MLREALEGIAARPIALDEAADLPGEQTANPTRNNAPVNSEVASARREVRSSRWRATPASRPPGVGYRPDAADQRGLAARRLHPSMQLGDEGAVVLVLRRHQRDGLPGRRKDRDAPAAGTFDIGAKAAGLHRHRPVRQTDRRDIGIGPDPGPAADLPRQSGIGQFELMRRPDQRRLVGILVVRAPSPSVAWFGSDVGNPKYPVRLKPPACAASRLYLTSGPWPRRLIFRAA